MKSKKIQKHVGDQKTFGERLRVAMDKESISVMKLCKTIGKSDVTIYKYLDNTTLPAIDTAHEIAKVLNVPYIWLTIGEGSMASGKTDVMSEANLKKTHTDLYTVVKAVEQLINRVNRQKKKFSGKQVAETVALLCMIASEGEEKFESDNVIHIMKSMEDE
nr:helix-turn-helix domain-containing protein [Cytophagales bacterium]